MEGGEILGGGCQCGAVRYAARVERLEAYYCLLPLPDVPEGTARRGFCRACGIPLTFEYMDDGRKIDVTVGSLDEPGRTRPVGHFGSEGIVGPFFTDDGLPRERTDDEALAQRWRASHGPSPGT